MMFVDSSVWIDYFNGRETPQTLFLRDRADRTAIVVGDLILCEVLQGFRMEEHLGLQVVRLVSENSTS